MSSPDKKSQAGLKKSIAYLLVISVLMVINMVCFYHNPRSLLLMSLSCVSVLCLFVPLWSIVSIAQDEGSKQVDGRSL